MSEKGLIVVVSGPAGSGKGTVMKYIKEDPNYVFSISRTTRYTREGEVDGVHYYFVSKEEFKQKLLEDDFLEHTEYCGEFYGTPKSLVYEQLEKGKNVILEIEVDGAMQIKAKCPDAVLIMLLPPSFSVQEARLRGRATETEEKILARLARTREELRDLDNYDYVVYNRDGEIDEAAEDILAIVRAEKLSLSRNPDAEKKYFEI
jgi:guanylate kinase